MRTLAALVMIVATATMAQTAIPLCTVVGTAPIEEASDATLEMVFTSMGRCAGGTKSGRACATNADCPASSCVVPTTIPSLYTYRVDAHTASGTPAALVPATSATPAGSSNVIEAIIPASANRIVGVTRPGQTEDHSVTVVAHTTCRGGVNIGVACDADADCPASTCGTVSSACRFPVKALQYVP